ncbi:hypothetical protein JZ751_015123 [Albula glossodonta]|uniref:Uncharacterized protein n=1 Tax=Albula glossodonta TaxID=121402 RepID=A0A8T2P2M1_9TELE|nr:hypothetical protein JZ751_015123 [Albula glossodonta]
MHTPFAPNPCPPALCPCYSGSLSCFLFLNQCCYRTQYHVPAFPDWRISSALSVVICYAQCPRLEAAVAVSREVVCEALFWATASRSMGIQPICDKALVLLLNIRGLHRLTQLLGFTAPAGAKPEKACLSVCAPAFRYVCALPLTAYTLWTDESVGQQWLKAHIGETAADSSSLELHYKTLQGTPENSTGMTATNHRFSSSKAVLEWFKPQSSRSENTIGLE